RPAQRPLYGIRLSDMFFRTGMKRVSLPFHAMPLSLLKRKITRYFGSPGTDSLSTICGMKYCDAEIRAP
ncbi:MAG: hypothetical protein KIG21_05965, partial [Angelakisella sp.]|nr:hypothetical protein [Angelakisella sp.]